MGQLRAIVHHQPDAAPDLYLDNLGVAPAWRRRGIGRALVEAARQEARRRGCRELWLAAEPDNDEARAFYTALGWRIQPALLVSRSPG